MLFSETWFRRLLAGSLLAGSLLAPQAARAQTLVDFSLYLPIALVPVAIDEVETAEVAVHSACPYPVELKVYQFPYWAAGEIPLPVPDPKTLTVSPGNPTTFTLALENSSAGVAHAEIGIAPGENFGEARSCFAPGQNLVSAALGIFSGGTVRSIVQLPLLPPEQASPDGPAYPPDPFLIPLSAGSRLHVLAAHNCPSGVEQETEVFLDDIIVAKTLDKATTNAERTVASLESPVNPGFTGYKWYVARVSHTFSGASNTGCPASEFDLRVVNSDGSSAGTRPSVLYSGNVHAREWVP